MKIAFVLQPIFRVPVNKSISIPLLNHELAKRLALSHEVIVYAGGNRIHKKIICDDGILYYGMPTGADEVFLKVFKGWRLISRFRNDQQPLFGYSFYYGGYILQVALDLRKQKCDVVHIHHLSQSIPVIRAINPEIKIVLHMNMDWLTQLDHLMIETRLSQSDLILGCSNYITERIRQRFPQVADRCHTVFNGVDVDHFIEKDYSSTITNNAVKRILFVGRVSPEKGVHTLLDAFKKVVEDYPDVQLDIIGKQLVLPLNELIALSDDTKVKELASFYSGSYLSSLKNRLPLHVASQVSFVGGIPNLQLLNFYHKADILIFPSIWNEPFGISNVEAMASGVPVVATRVGGVLEIVEDGKTGLLVERDDSTALSNAILYLLSNDNERKSMGQAGRQRAVELFSWDKLAEKLMYHYRNLFENS
ncbi:MULTISPECIES: glycosyltransferase family 4 protein [unclassified Coleofasciculus]|uniref:glycosyltransferase family 4 protein n=1 Tax=unclassified Coleofasciculus TaxID=2692782 RepID=UPI00187FD628|nr:MULTISPECIES: glycosyltransferase family 4 protein [unclassified Coleofasciculus]MBE9125748.1 glycosyltransferase family 4 protein [Coleofasciculus sp. LEGE 07081]MBE9147236.1 glycosyltransferase family 4 protein [Coleofasciculus sp. LEGE 07092]